jgi:hypothetical protein
MTRKLASNSCEIAVVKKSTGVQKNRVRLLLDEKIDEAQKQLACNNMQPLIIRYIASIDIQITGYIVKILLLYTIYATGSAN